MLLYRSADDTTDHVGFHYAEDKGVAAAYLWSDYGGPILFSVDVQKGARWLVVEGRPELIDALEDAGLVVDGDSYGQCADVLAYCHGAIAALAKDYDLVEIPENYPDETTAVVVLREGVVNNPKVLGELGDLEARISAEIERIQWADEDHKESVEAMNKNPSLLLTLKNITWEDAEDMDADDQVDWWTRADELLVPYKVQSSPKSIR